MTLKRSLVVPAMLWQIYAHRLRHPSSSALEVASIEDCGEIGDDRVCGGAGQFCCNHLSGQMRGVLSSADCVNQSMHYVLPCAPEGEKNCGEFYNYNANVGSHTVCEDRHRKFCCDSISGQIRGYLQDVDCRVLGIPYASPCERQSPRSLQEQGYEVIKVLDGGNCLFDAIARVTNPALLRKPLRDEKVAAEARLLRQKAAHRIAADANLRLSFFNGLRTESAWLKVQKKFLRGLTAVFNPAFVDHNDMWFIEWIKKDWQFPPKNPSTVYYGNRLVLRVLANELDVSVRVLNIHGDPDGADIEGNLANANLAPGAGKGKLVYIQQIDQHYNAVAPKEEDSELVAQLEEMLQRPRAEVRKLVKQAYKLYGQSPTAMEVLQMMQVF